MAERKDDQWTKVPMQEQDPKERAKNFDEVPYGYTEEEMLQEANRCLSCKVPQCEKGCPVDVPIKDFIDELKENNVAEAANIIKSQNSLPAICGRVCPQEEQCELECVVGKRGEPIAIGRLERYAADWAMQQGEEEVKRAEPRGHSVAVVGGGPAGLTAAGDLARMGYDVTVYEGLHLAGGVLTYGIPEFRLPKAIVQEEIGKLRDLNVDIQTNVIVGKTVMIDELLNEMGFSAVFVGAGAGLPMFVGIEGENNLGVYSANEFLTRLNLMKAYKFPEYDTPVKVGDKVAVIGAGNTAMDAARTALRCGASEVNIVYRRSQKEMTAREEEYHHAVEEGIKFNWLTNPVEFLGDENNWLYGMRCVEMELGEPDDSGRARPVPIEGSEFEMETDVAVLALGTNPNPVVPSATPGLETEDWGGIIADEETGETTREGVFAGGDVVTGAATVILAMGAGKTAATAIDEYIRDKYGE